MAEAGQDKALVAAHDPVHGDLGHAERPEDWGWHHEWRRSTPVAGWLSVISLLLLTFGNHEGHVEDLYLVGGAAFLALLLVRSQIAKRNAWRN